MLRAPIQIITREGIITMLFFFNRTESDWPERYLLKPLVLRDDKDHPPELTGEYHSITSSDNYIFIVQHSL